MEFSSFFFHLLFFSQIFELSNTIVSSTKVEIPTQNEPTDKLNSLKEQMDADIGKRLVQQRIKRYTTAPEVHFYIDHRQSDCFPEEPRNQGSNCDASYAFATISFYEWIYCRKTGTFEAFSEQFIIDCGDLRGNHGCNGGDPEHARMFVEEFGLISREYYPYTGIQGNCPSGSQLGNMRGTSIDEIAVMYAPLDQLAQHLVYGPIIVTIEIGNGFLSYAGGVDDNVGHTPELLHTMLLIGHGRERGKEFWLFRNSHSTTFGGNELGHYKLNKNVNCFSGEFGIGLGGHIGI